MLRNEIINLIENVFHEKKIWIFWYV
jgi:hypothetical protein